MAIKKSYSTPSFKSTNQHGLKKTRSTPQIYSLSKSRSHGRLQALGLSADPGLTAVTVARDLSFQSGMSSVICYEKFSDNLQQAPDLAVCLETPLLEEIMSVDVKEVGQEEVMGRPTSPHLRRGSRRD